MSTEQSLTKKYRVKLGLAEVVVEGCSKDEATRLARKKLCRDMPLLYDIIHRAEDQEFQIDELSADPS